MTAYLCRACNASLRRADCVTYTPNYRGREVPASELGHWIGAGLLPSICGPVRKVKLTR